MDSVAAEQRQQHFIYHYSNSIEDTLKGGALKRGTDFVEQPLTRGTRCGTEKNSVPPIKPVSAISSRFLELKLPKSVKCGAVVRKRIHRPAF